MSVEVKKKRKKQYPIVVKKNTKRRLIDARQYPLEPFDAVINRTLGFYEANNCGKNS